LEAYLEDDMNADMQTQMEAHARACTECGALLADLRRIVQNAGQLPALRPSHDLWNGIRERIETPVVPIAPRQVWKSSRVYALAAAALVAAVGLGYGIARFSTHAAPVEPARTAPALQLASTPASVRLASATPQAVEASYDAEITGLRAIIAQRRPKLDSATVALLDRNLAVIDTAIAQCKAALAKDPDSRFLMSALNQSLDTKVQVLRTTAALPSST
jgi:hypothetical protein